MRIFNHAIVSCPREENKNQEARQFHHEKWRGGQFRGTKEAETKAPGGMVKDGREKGHQADFFNNSEKRHMGPTEREMLVLRKTITGDDC
jgi:hypothetical protein